MSALRRPRIKASASHLASLAGRRRVGASEVKETKTIGKDDAISASTTAASPINITEKPAKEIQDSEEPASNNEVVSNSEDKPRLKARFRPNLSESDQQRGRLRRISGCESALSPLPTTPGRVRTISGSSEPESSSVPLKRPPPVQRIVHEEDQARTTSPGPLRTRQLSENNIPPPVFSPPSIPPASSPASITSSRTRKLTESSVVTETNNPTVFDQRKADHKKKFVDGIPERTKLTMFDLIYYNPSDGNRMSNSSSLRSSRAPSVDARRDSEDAVVPNRLDAVAERLREEAVDDPDQPQGKTSEDDDEALPVPQVKVGADGNIILDEASTLIETTATKKAKEDLLKSPLVFESANQATNYGSWGKKKKNADWSDKDTVKFYKALSVFGTDFSLMEGVFKKRSRHELKMKFKKEEKVNRSLVDKCLSQGQAFDPSIFDTDEDDSEEEENNKKKEKENRRKKKVQENNTKKKRKHRIKGRRYYVESDDADESELASENEVAMVMVDNLLTKKRPATAAGGSPGPEEPAKKPKTSQVSLLKSILSQGAEAAKTASPSFALPPALLAANPGLANASPGSLVVVASPASPHPTASNANAQLLEVFMVGEDNDQNGNPEKASSLPKRTRTISESHLDTTSIGRVRTHSGTFQS